MESLTNQCGKRVFVNVLKHRNLFRDLSGVKVKGFSNVGGSIFLNGVSSVSRSKPFSLPVLTFIKQAPAVLTSARRNLSISTCLYSGVTRTVEKGEGESDSTSSSSSSSDEDDNDDQQEGDEYEQESGGFRNENLIKLSPLQKAIITVGSGLSSFFDPTRAENIATFGEISAGLVLNRLYQRMMEDDEGRRILQQKPRINSKTVNLDYLATLPEGTLGWAYVQFLRKNQVTPDSRLPVKFIEDPELAYVMQRYREVHDLVHTVTGQPTNMLGEVVVKWIEGIQTGLPMCVTGGLFGATRLRPKQRQRYINSHLKWAIDVGFTSKPFLYIYYEERWEQSLKELQHYICPQLLTPPPDTIIKRKE